MAVKSFYSSPEYKEKQRQRSKAVWDSGRFAFLLKKETRVCQRLGCDITFEVIPSDPKKYCSSRCSAKVNNRTRGAPSLATRHKIAQSMLGAVSPFKGVIKVPHEEVKCQNLECQKDFMRPRWKKARFCSVACAVHVTGSRPTSPKAARAKAGVRLDIDDTTYFYSRWEANIARLFNHFCIKWIHQPETFDLHKQKYTPDFYLPEYDLYIEVKNFLAPYSKDRDEKFRKFYPKVALKLLLKDEYLTIEKNYSIFIPHWEYKNSRFGGA